MKSQQILLGTTRHETLQEGKVLVRRAMFARSGPDLGLWETTERQGEKPMSIFLYLEGLLPFLMIRISFSCVISHGMLACGYFSDCAIRELVRFAECLIYNYIYKLRLNQIINLNTKSYRNNP